MRLDSPSLQPAQGIYSGGHRIGGSSSFARRDQAQRLLDKNDLPAKRSLERTWAKEDQDHDSKVALAVEQGFSKPDIESLGWKFVHANYERLAWDDFLRLAVERRVLRRAADFVTDDQKAALLCRAHASGIPVEDLLAEFEARRCRELLGAGAATPNPVDAAELIASAEAFRLAIDALPVGRDIRRRLGEHLDRHLAAIRALA